MDRTESITVENCNLLRGTSRGRMGSLLRRVFRPFAFFAFGLLAIYVLTRYWFGSMRNVMAYLNGHSVVVEATTVSAGSVPPGGHATAQYRLRNLTFAPVTVVGATRSCACMVVDELPLTIRPGGVATLSLRIAAGGVPPGTTFEHTALLLFDVDNPTVVLRATGRVQ